MIIYPPLCPSTISNAMLQGSDGIHVVLNSLQLWWQVAVPGPGSHGVETQKVSCRIFAVLNAGVADSFVKWSQYGPNVLIA